MKLEDEIERLDREWQARRTELLVRGKRGVHRPPSREQAILMALVAPIILLPMLVPWLIGSSVRLPGVLWLFAGGLVLGLMFLAARMYSRAVEYERARREHDVRRADLVAQLEARGPRRLRQPTIKGAKAG